MTGKRPWREAKLPAEAVREVVHETYFKRFDREIVATLVQALSAYPLHSWVRLASCR